MGYIIIDEAKLQERISLWNNSSYKDKVLMDVHSAKVDYSHMIEALQQEEIKINEKIKQLESQKGDISALMRWANGLQ